MGQERKQLPREIQITLGQKLRDVYRAYVGLPLPLLSLARRIPETSTFKNPRDMLPPVDNEAIPNRDVLDPETIGILVDAYNKAWNDLRTLKNNPATDETLARMLLALMKEGERHPSQLATKAVLKIIEKG